MNLLTKVVTPFFQRQMSSSTMFSFLNDYSRPFSNLVNWSNPINESSPSLLRTDTLNGVQGKQNMFSGSGIYELGDNGYTVKLNLKKFKPENIFVKTKSNKIIVQSELQNLNPDPKSEFERKSRLFVRIYQVPTDGDMKNTTADLMSDGVLVVQVPKLKLEPEAVEEHCVPVNYLPVSLKAKEIFEKK
uniref:Heat shock protein 26 n=1 Tax=Cacopsylla melanoneura TaxID=428564 RepID=A0A8D8WZJ8_9HEMI